MSGIKRIRNLLSGGAEDRSFRCRSRQTNEDCIVEVSSPTGRTVSEFSPEECSGSQTTDKVWTLEECRILHEMEKPITIVLYDSQGTQQLPPRVLFQNTNCQQRFGLPRSQFDYLAVAGTVSERAREAHDAWLQRIQQGVRTQQMDVYGLFRPLFQGIAKEMPKSLVRIDSRPMQMQISPGKTVTAIMHVVALNWSHEDMRFKAMLQCNPFHSFMFNSQGDLLCASAAAIEGGTCRDAGSFCDKLTLGSLFTPDMYKDNAMEAQKAYDIAINAVFEQQVECHRHIQTHVSVKTGKLKWTMMEMWPMLDPVNDGSAVLVTRYNITQHKELEHELVIRQSSLEQQKQDLEQATAVMQEAKEKLEEEAHSLAQKLEAVLQEKYKPCESFDADTPIDKTLKLLQTIIGGTQPSVQEALDLHYILSQSDTDLRQPVGLEEQLMADERLGSAVGKSMLQLLQGDGVPIRKLAAAATTETDELMTCPWTAGSGKAVTARRAASMEQELQALDGSDEGEEFVPYCVMPHVERLLQKAEMNWQFDMFSLAEATPGNTLSLLAFHLINRAGFIQQFNLDEGKLCRFLQRVEKGYDASNPYHNSTHVACVLQMTHMLLCHGGLLKTNAFLGSLHLTTYWSAIIHDFQHGGVNNDFLIKTAHPIALTYNDQSPLEHHHLASAFQVFLDPQCQYVRSEYLPPESARLARACSINQVLGTDMKKHFDIVSRFQAVFKRDHASNSGAETPASSSSTAERRLEWNSVRTEDQTLIHQMVLKCADIGHLAADWNSHKRWACQLEEEFYRQGDKERRMGLLVSPLMDREQPGGMVRSQLGFFSIVGIPMFSAITDLFKDAQPMLDGVLTNYRSWEKLLASAPKPSSA